MKGLVKVLRNLSLSISGTACLLMCCVDATSNNWMTNLFKLFGLFAVSLSVGYLFDLLHKSIDRSTLRLPDSITVLFASLIYLRDKFVRNDVRSTKRRRYVNNTKVIRIEDYLDKINNNRHAS